MELQLDHENPVGAAKFMFRNVVNNISISI